MSFLSVYHAVKKRRKITLRLTFFPFNSATSSYSDMALHIRMYAFKGIGNIWKDIYKAVLNFGEQPGELEKKPFLFFWLFFWFFFCFMPFSLCIFLQSACYILNV